ncbi:MAG: VWA domain-containing protein [Planctomycetes bacterium]|nr:VWA domain-containing protein [Planctomycetota bacterium]NOG53287.1 VWA domain-containing protein [Planctomycetota bacterium]
MTWASPGLALIVAACVVPPLILLYFLKLRRREVSIPSTLLWMQSVQDLQANAPFQRLRMNLLLFLQLLALCLMLLALAQPQWAGVTTSSSRTVLLIDRSGSMTARDVEPTRLAEAKRQAVEYVKNIRTGGLFSRGGQAEQVMIISFAQEARVQCPFTSSQAELTEAIESIGPTHERTSLARALELARAYTINTDPETDKPIGPPATLIVFSDGQIRDLSDLVTRDTVLYRPIGDEAALGNVGIVEFGADRAPTNLSEIVVYARIANYRMTPALVDVLFSVGDQLVGSKRIEVPAAYQEDPRQDTGAEGPAESDDAEADAPIQPGGAALTLRPGMTGVEFPLVQARGVTIGVSLDLDDVLKADNQAFVVVPQAKRLRVGLVDAKSFFIPTAVEGVPFVEVVEMIPAPRFQEMMTTDRGQPDTYDMMIVDNVALPAQLPAGRYLIFSSYEGLDGFEASTEEKPDGAQVWDEQHPVSHWVNFNPLYVHSYHPMSVPTEAHVLVDGAFGPLLVEYVHGGAHCLILPFEFLKSNWMLDENMLKFVQNAVNYLGHSGQMVVSEPYEPGETVVARLPRDATDIAMRLVSQAEDEGGAGAGAGRKVLTPIDPAMTTYRAERAGLYALSFRQSDEEEEQTRYIAVNMGSDLESNVRPSPTLRIGTDETRTVRGEDGLQKKPLWPWLLLAALAVITVEWWVYSRRAFI